MKPADRYAWIESYLKVRSFSVMYTVDVCAQHFVDAYIEATGANFVPQVYGAHRCRQLGKDLSMMQKNGRLSRCRIGLGDMHSRGFPSWVWCYKLNGSESPTAT